VVEKRWRKMDVERWVELQWGERNEDNNVEDFDPLLILSLFPLLTFYLSFDLTLSPIKSNNIIKRVELRKR
jgi:hypothetical protein